MGRKCSIVWLSLSLHNLFSSSLSFIVSLLSIPSIVSTLTDLFSSVLSLLPTGIVPETGRFQSILSTNDFTLPLFLFSILLIATSIQDLSCFFSFIYYLLLSSLSLSPKSFLRFKFIVFWLLLDKRSIWNDRLYFFCVVFRGVVLTSVPLLSVPWRIGRKRKAVSNSFLFYIFQCFDSSSNHSSAYWFTSEGEREKRRISFFIGFLVAVCVCFESFISCR